MALAKLSKNTGIYLLGNALNRLGAFLLLPLYTNYLSLEEYGALEMIYTVNAVLALFFGAGLAHSTLRFYFEKKDPAYRHAVISTNIAISLAIAACGALIALFFVPEISQWLFSDSERNLILYLALFAIVIELNSEVMLAYLRAIEKAMMFVVLSVVRLIVQVAVSVYLVGYKEMSIEGVLIANVCALSAIWIFLLIYTYGRIGFVFAKKLIKPILQYSIPFAASGIVGVVFASIDRFLLKELVSMESVGLYGLAMKFSLLLSFFLFEPFNRGYGPYRFNIMNDQDAPQKNAKILFYISLIGAFVGLGVALFTPLVIELIAEPSYFAASSIVPFLILGIWATGLNYVFQTGILVKKQTKTVFRVSVIKLIVSLPLFLLLIPEYGATGAALAFSLSNVVMAIMTLYFSQKVYPIPFPIIKVIAAVVLGSLVYALSTQIVTEVFWMNLAEATALMLLFLAVAWLVFGELRKDVTDLIRKRKLAQS